MDIMLFPMDSFGGAFLTGEIMGFIEDIARACRKCGRDSFNGEDDLGEFDDYGDYICPRCRDDYDWDDEDGQYK